MKIKFFNLVLFLIIAQASAQNKTLLGDTDGEWNLLGFTGYAGEVVINPLTGSSYFYWLFQALQGNILTDKYPLVIWLAGGPGCSGDPAVIFDYITPFIIDDNGEPILNPNNWVNQVHFMTIDHPIGTGFSFSNSPGDYKNNTSGDTNQLYTLLIRLAQKYPTWFNRDIYFFGVSYGGKWAPAIAYKILSENQGPNPPYRFNVKGVGVGDPWIIPAAQTSFYGYVAYQSGLINQEELSIIQTYENEIQNQINSGDLPAAQNNIDNILNLIYEYSGGINYYDIRKFTNYNSSAIEYWLNLNSTKTLLHAPLNIEHQGCNDNVFAYTNDFMASEGQLFPYLLENINVLMWIGQDDLLISTPAVQNVVANINWPGIQGLINSNKMIWRVNGAVAGYVRQYSTFTFVNLLKSGHIGCHDQPLNARDMFFRFIYNEGWQQ